MINGYVNSQREAVIVLTIQGANGLTADLEAVIDTGFTGYLTLSSAIIATLSLDELATSILTLADGSKIVSELYQATVVWDGQSRLIEVDTLETEVLVGMALMEGFDLKIRVAEGGAVTIESTTSTPA